MVDRRAYSTEREGPGPIVDSKPGIPCKLCGRQDGSIGIHFPTFRFISGDFEAPLWEKHEKFYCPHCRFLWSTWMDSKSLEEYGKAYVKANYDHQRKPSPRMLAAPHLLLRLLLWTGGKRFLDYGVGYNTPYIYDLRGRGIDVWGCDISATVPYSRFIRYVPSNDLPEGTFDGIYSVDVAEHFSDIKEDYTRMKHLLRPGGIMLHCTYWLHRHWNGTLPFPRKHFLWNPWHLSLCSSRTMEVIAEQVGLEYLGTIRLPVDTRQGYILRKPPDLGWTRLLARWLEPNFWSSLRELNAHMKYASRAYREL